MSFSVITNCFDEPDLLPFFIDHYERQGAAEIRILYDRNSELDDLHNRLTRSEARITSTTDWVLMPDVDEFIVSKDGRTIQDVLAGMPEFVDVLGCEGWMMIRNPDYQTHEKWQRDMTLTCPDFCLAGVQSPLTNIVRYGVPSPFYGKPIVIRPASMAIHTAGFHELIGRKKPELEPFKLLHYVGATREIFIRRRMRQASRLGAKNAASGCGQENAGKTRKDFEREWDALPFDKLVRVI